MVQHYTNVCSPETELTTIKQCSSAKAVLDPSAPAVESENYKGAPKGCSRHKGEWFFNTHEEGTLDGISEPICKAEPNRT